jgi:hypothetical protein
VNSQLQEDVRIPLFPVIFIGLNSVNPLSKSAEKTSLFQSQNQIPPKKLKQTNVISIREMNQKDLDDVMEIESESFACPYERSEFIFFFFFFLKICFRNQDYFDHILARGHYFAWVAVNEEKKNKVVGYIALRIANNWTEIQSVAVCSTARGNLICFLKYFSAKKPKNIFEFLFSNTTKIRTWNWSRFDESSFSIE